MTTKLLLGERVIVIAGYHAYHKCHGDVVELPPSNMKTTLHGVEFDDGVVKTLFRWELRRVTVKEVTNGSKAL